MNLHFLITLTEHRKLGFVFAPYLVQKKKTLDYYIIYDRLTLLNYGAYRNILTPEQVQLIKIIEDYNDQNLLKIFSKKKISSSVFISSIDTTLFQTQIRPYIERRMAKCIDIMAFNPVPVYHKVLQNNIYIDDRIEVVEDEGQTVFNFVKTPEELRYFLTIEHQGEELKLNGKKGLIAINEPCCVIVDDKLFVFRDIDGKKLTPFFSREFIGIPKSAEKKYFETFVRNAIKKYKVKAEGFTIQDEDIKPEPALSIETDLSGRYHIMLKFKYDEDSIYYANRKTETKVKFRYAGEQPEFTRLSRNYSCENDYITKLLSMGLVNKEGPYFRPVRNEKDLTASGYNIINWINFSYQNLLDHGFSVAQNKLDKKYYLNEFRLRMEVDDQNNDWFDIEARVEFSGFVIPFTSFHRNILEEDREYLLPDGQLMILPEEWFVSYRDLLKFARVEKEKLILGKQHFSLLNREVKGIAGGFKNDLLTLINDDLQNEKIPEGVNAELRPYQTEGYSWLYRLSKNGFGGCLADDMGLGKTLQTLTTIKRVLNETRTNENHSESHYTSETQLSLFDAPLPDYNRPENTILIVVPTSLVHNWMNETLRFVPDLKIQAYVGGQRKDLQELKAQNDIIITSYGILRNDLEQFIKVNFLYLVLDESQVIKNPGSKTYKAVLQLNAENRIVLTGTPIENSLSDLWAQINFLNPGLLGNINFFKSEFQWPIEKHSDEEKQEKLKKLIAPFVLRRAKTEVAKDLPPFNEQLVFCNLNEEQESYYEKEKSKIRNLLIEQMSMKGYNKSSVVVLQSLTRLRQIANHPSLVDEEYFSGSGKYDEIIRNLQSLRAEGNKALIFSSFVKHLDLVAEYLDKNNIQYAWLTGQTKERESEIKKFQENEDCPFFLISLKAGGVGLNLTAAEYVLILDPWWNPAAEMQAVGRAHRIGQEKHVFVYRFVARNTLEEKILKLQQRKSKLADAFVNNSLKDITEEQVMELFE